MTGNLFIREIRDELRNLRRPASTVIALLHHSHSAHLGGLVMQLTLKVEDKRAIMRLAGRFEFNMHREFRESVDAVLQNKDVDSVVIDLAAVEYLDSSALGMLLMLRDRTNTAKKSLSLANPRGMVKQALEIARFDKLFSIV
jgi:anti-anti-sigma factor